MKIIADENIPQVKEAFSRFGDVILINGREINNELLKNADLLLVRSITNVNENLLDNSKVKFVATATIGTDHVDMEYLKSKNILFADAKGCNAYSVAEYVLCAITNIYYKHKQTFENKKIGIVGYGNIGTKVYRFTEALGFQTIINDPPLERNTGKNIFHNLKEALESDIITFHVPLNMTGVDKTLHLLNKDNLDLIKQGSLLINTSRGQVVDNQIIKERLKVKNDIAAVFDVWENEPLIDIEFAERTNISTAHIAGYSLEGKLNGTKLIYNQFCELFGYKNEWNPNYPNVENNVINVNTHEPIEKILYNIFNSIYNIESDNQMLKKCLSANKEFISKCFDDLRKNYRIRREFSNYTLKLDKESKHLKEILETLRFKVI